MSFNPSIFTPRQESHIWFCLSVHEKLWFPIKEFHYFLCMFNNGIRIYLTSNNFQTLYLYGGYLFWEKICSQWWSFYKTNLSIADTSLECLLLRASTVMSTYINSHINLSPSLIFQASLKSRTIGSSIGDTIVYLCR